MKLKAPWLKFYDGIRKNLCYRDETISEAVFRVAEKYPQNTALIYMNEKVSYEKLRKNIFRVLEMLKQIGVKKGERLMVCLPNIPQAVYLLYAANHIGAVCSFVHPLSAPMELVKFINELDAEYIFALDSMKEVFSDVFSHTGARRLIMTSPADELNCLKQGLYKISQKQKIQSGTALCWKTLMKNVEETDFPKADMSSEETSVVLFSGGTTGEPKGVMLSSKSINAMGFQTAEMSHCQVQGKSMLAAMPMFHGFGLCVCVHTVLINGGTCILVPRFTVREYARLIKRHRPNFIAGVPTLFEALIGEKAMNKADLSCLLGVFSGGDTLSVKLKKRFDEFLKEHNSNVKIREGYGATECVTASCLTPYNIQKEGSIGIPFPDTYYKICAVGTTCELPYNTEGEICIYGPALMKGYLNDDEETAKVLKTHEDGRLWLHTGDAGVMDEDGFVYFRYRLKRIIVTSGYNVYPQRIEALLNSHPAVKESCVVGVSDPYKMQRIKAFVVPENNFQGNLKEELFALCRQNVARYAVPSEIEFRESLPRTKFSKVAYTELERENP